MKNRKKMGGCLTLLLFLLTASFASGQTDSTDGGERKEDVLHLKDGSVLKGEVLGYEGDTLRIEMGGGQIIELARSELEDVRMNKGERTQEEEKVPGPTPEEEAKGSASYHREGYQHHLSHGFFIHNDGADRDFQTFSLHTYRFSPYLATGIYFNTQFFYRSRGRWDLHLFPHNGVGGILTGDLIKNTPITPYWFLQGGSNHYLLSEKWGFFGYAGGGIKFYFTEEGHGMSIRTAYQIADRNYGDERDKGFNFHKGLSLRLVLHI